MIHFFVVLVKNMLSGRNGSEIKLKFSDSVYFRGCQRCNFVLQSAINCLNLKWQLVHRTCRLKSKKAILEVATSNLQK